MRVPMIATRAMTYATRQLKADDEFEASRADARLLAALGRAKLVEAKPGPVKVDAPVQAAAKAPAKKAAPRKKPTTD